MKLLRALVRFCRLSLESNDQSDYPTAQFSKNGIATDALRWSPYGLSSNPPVNSLGLMLLPYGRSDSPVVISDLPLERFKPLKPGEVKLGNYLTKASLFFDEAGEIEITAKAGASVKITVSGGGDVEIEAGAGNVSIAAATVAIDGDVTVTGTITATGDIVGAGISVSTHTHPYLNGATPATTGTPT